MVQYIVDFLNAFQGLRKSIVMLFLMIITVVLRVKGYLGPDNVEGLLKATVTGYFASNGLEHYTAMVKERLTSKGTMAPVESIESTTSSG